MLEQIPMKIIFNDRDGILNHEQESVTLNLHKHSYQK